LLSVLQHSINPNDYTSAELFGLDYQAVSFLKKCPLSVVTSDEKEAAATRKFWEAEEDCRATNARFRSRYSGGIGSPLVEAVLHGAQRKIFNWIGEGPNPHEWALRCRFGPGADDKTSGAKVGAYHKLSALSATAEFADCAVSLALDHPPWARYLAGFDIEVSDGSVSEISCSIQPGNIVLFVLKTAMIFRTIAKEPRDNVFAQLGLGAILRDCLRTRAKLDLNTQRPNQDLAYDASLKGHLATIDLISASGTIAREFVRDLLPEGWFNALDICRSRMGYLNGSWFNYEQFSSMGNGYTFELESLIFYALVSATCEHLGIVNYYSRVFGDDIVCPVEAVASLEEVLRYCGFRVNPEKSFSSGVFRESCGADFFDGTNVRPHFCKEVPTDATSLYNLANGIRRASYRLGRGHYCDRRFRPAWLRTVRRIPEPLRSLYTPSLVTERVWGPDIEAGDGGLALNPDEFLSTAFARFNREYQAGFYFGTALPVPWKGRVDDKTPSLTLLYALYRCKDGSLPEGTAPGVVTGRSSLGRRLTVRAYTLTLADYGLWL